ncbi:hypothetical protein L7F22_060689 [Adiantum nelumboides]|nr:hypothetical protein [Adiantum nelumboides]
MYAMVATRLDIAFVVGVVSRFMSNPSKKHWEAVKRVLRYLAGTKDKCICFGKGKLSVVEYIDADFARDLDKRKSISGYFYTFASGAISWFSRLQSCVTLSTIEAKYVAASESIWLTRLVPISVTLCPCKGLPLTSPFSSCLGMECSDKGKPHCEWLRKIYVKAQQCL